MSSGRRALRRVRRRHSLPAIERSLKRNDCWLRFGRDADSVSTSSQESVETLSAQATLRIVSLTEQKHLTGLRPGPTILNYFNGH